MSSNEVRCPVCNRKMRYSTRDIVWRCYNCDSAYIETAGELEEVFRINSYSSEPAGCAACGNPAYPNCKISCPMYDD